MLQLIKYCCLVTILLIKPSCLVRAAPRLWIGNWLFGLH
jgi:hypothetical protein